MHNCQAVSQCELYFYQGSNLSIALGAANTRVLWAGAIACAQLSNHDAATAVFQCDRANTIMGGSRKARAQTFSPYGFMEPQRSTTLVTFTGRRPDKLTGNYSLGKGYREFNPRTMRFHQPDALSPFGKGGLNSYSYCFADPINRHDPTGRWPQWLTRFKSWLFGDSAQAPREEIPMQAIRGQADEPLQLGDRRPLPLRRDSNDSDRLLRSQPLPDVVPRGQPREAALPPPPVAVGTLQQISWRDVARLVISGLPSLSAQYVTWAAIHHVMQDNRYGAPVAAGAALTVGGGTLFYLNRKVIKKLYARMPGIRRQQ